jgi:hypothetical protein
VSKAPLAALGAGAALTRASRSLSAGNYRSACRILALSQLGDSTVNQIGVCEDESAAAPWNDFDKSAPLAIRVRFCKTCLKVRC